MGDSEAAGRFDVTLTPEPDPQVPVGRMRIEKRFEGDLVATSLGTMLAVRTPVAGSAGYVAMEIVTGTLAGRTGSFALQHSGTMARGTPTLSVSVVPDSGADGLAGLSGRMDISVAGSEHSYRLRYALPD